MNDDFLIFQLVCTNFRELPWVSSPLEFSLQIYYLACNFGYILDRVHTTGFLTSFTILLSGRDGCLLGLFGLLGLLGLLPMIVFNHFRAHIRVIESLPCHPLPSTLEQ